MKLYDNKKKGQKKSKKKKKAEVNKIQQKLAIIWHSKPEMGQNKI